mmetsp:Transcript_3368/g.9790  ORF Transcript_3368/g.9790 Transcript_3368/m.9790 type:complete len:465 (-) Transcript_3368:869-2263(-)
MEPPTLARGEAAAPTPARPWPREHRPSGHALGQRADVERCPRNDRPWLRRPLRSRPDAARVWVPASRRGSRRVSHPRTQQPRAGDRQSPAGLHRSREQSKHRRAGRLSGPQLAQEQACHSLPPVEQWARVPESAAAPHDATGARLHLTSSLASLPGAGAGLGQVSSPDLVGALVPLRRHQGGGSSDPAPSSCVGESPGAPFHARPLREGASRERCGPCAPCTGSESRRRGTVGSGHLRACPRRLLARLRHRHWPCRQQERRGRPRRRGSQAAAGRCPHPPAEGQAAVGVPPPPREEAGEACASPGKAWGRPGGLAPSLQARGAASSRRHRQPACPDHTVGPAGSAHPDGARPGPHGATRRPCRSRGRGVRRTDPAGALQQRGLSAAKPLASQRQQGLRSRPLPRGGRQQTLAAPWERCRPRLPRPWQGRPRLCRSDCPRPCCATVPGQEQGAGCSRSKWNQRHG